MMTAADLQRWRRDPITFMNELRNPDDDGKPFVLYPVQEQFMREALTLTPDGRLPYSELVYSLKKKSGKTSTASMMLLYAILVIGGRFAEGYALSNDYEQSVGRVFKQCARIIECTPFLEGTAKITAGKIEFLSTGATIEALASDYSGAAGSNPSFIVFDELWGYVSENARRLWDEMCPVPTRKVSARLTVTYAGYQGESILLEELLKRGLRGVAS